MRVRFWGARGSLAKPGPSTLRYGGNTSCVEVRTAAGTLIILDCGTGLHGLGQALMSAEMPSPRGHVLISHTHWDHIQGIPFFAPLFVPQAEWDIYGPKGIGPSLQDSLAGQMQYAYFPVALDQLDARIRYHELVEGTFQVEDVTVRTRYLNHPALTVAYRLEADGAAIVYASDHEPHSRHLVTGVGEMLGEDLKHCEFLAGADLVIHDAQYTAQEYPSKLGWGHSTVEYAVAVCRTAGAKRLALTHHDPLRSDDAIDRLVDEARAGLKGTGSVLEVFGAAEGQVIELVGARKHSGQTGIRAGHPGGLGADRAGAAACGRGCRRCGHDRRGRAGRRDPRGGDEQSRTRTRGGAIVAALLDHPRAATRRGRRSRGVQRAAAFRRCRGRGHPDHCCRRCGGSGWREGRWRHRLADPAVLERLRPDPHPGLAVSHGLPVGESGAA